jgi:DNA-binding CsgD family transcriptional regulator
MAACLGVPTRANAADGPDEAALGEIAGLLSGELPTAGAADPVLAAAERMLDLVDRRCARGPVLLTAENLQWADSFSLRVWNRLAYAVNQIPLLLVGIYRPGPSRSSVEKLRETARARGAVLVRPGPLPEHAAARLVTQVTGSAPGPRLRAELARAAGNPLYLRELLSALLDEGMAVVRDGVAEFDGAAGATPGSLAKAIGRRLEFLDPETLDTLRTAALLGTEFDASAAAVATGLPVSQLAHGIAQAEAAGIVSAAGERLAFRHELIQQVLVEQYTPDERRSRHARIARSLADGGAGVDAVALQLMAAPDGLEDWALDWLTRVPRGALYTAPDVSAELLTRAVRLAEPGESRWAELVERLAQVLLLLGRDAELIGFASAAAKQARNPALVAQLNVAEVRAAGRVGRPDHAIDVAQRALAQPGLPPHLRARLEAWKSVALTTAGRSAQGRGAARLALYAARASNDPLALAYAHHAIAFAATTAEGIGHIDEALSLLGSDAESMDLRVLLTHNRLIWLAQLGRMQEYEEALPSALVLAERVGTPRATSLLGAAAEVAFLRGDWDVAQLHLESIDTAYISSPDGLHLHGLGAVAALHRDDREGAVAHLAAVEAVTGPEMRVRGPRAVYLFEAQALRAEADGDPARALAVLATLLDTPPGLRRDERLGETPLLMRLALDAGDRDTARRTLDVIEAAARAEPLARRSAAARFCRAQFENDEQELSKIAELYKTHGWPLHAGAALEEAAVRAAQTGDIAHARATLTKAVRTYATLGAEWDIRRAENRLRTLGVRRGPRSTRTRQTTGWAALTTSELKIAKLVGHGWSNPDIATELSLSRRTVQTHVSNILGKLQLHSRLDVVRELANSEAANG